MRIPTGTDRPKPPQLNAKASEIFLISLLAIVKHHCSEFNISDHRKMACRFGTCDINNNRPKAKKPQQKAKKGKTPVVECSSSDWSDSDDSCSGCSACCGNSSSCTCSECNMETDSDNCYLSACRPRKTAKKPVKKGKVSKEKTKKPKTPAKKTSKAKKTKTPKTCYDCC